MRISYTHSGRSCPPIQKHAFPRAAEDEDGLSAGMLLEHGIKFEVKRSRKLEIILILSRKSVYVTRNLAWSVILSELEECKSA